MCFYKIVYSKILNFGYPVPKITKNTQPYKIIIKTDLRITILITTDEPLPMMTETLSQ